MGSLIFTSRSTRTRTSAGARATSPLLAAALSLLLISCGSRHADSSGPAQLSPQRVMGEVGLSPGQFVSPRCIDHDQSTLWVIDKEARVQRIDPATGNCLAIFKMPEYAFGKPTGLTIIPEPGHADTNLMFVADTHYHRVRVYRIPVARPSGPIPDTEPQLVHQFGAFGRDAGQFIFPTDVAVTTDARGQIDRIYVSEYGGNDRISIYDRNYTFLSSFGTFGNGESSSSAIEFSRPQSMAIDAARHELIVSDACNHRIGIFSLDGVLLRWLGGTQGADDAPGSFAYPYGLALAGAGRVIVSEYGNGRAQLIDTQSGASLAIFAGTVQADGSLQRLGNAWGVTILNDSVYTLDMLRSRIVSHKLPPNVSAAGGSPR